MGKKKQAIAPDGHKATLNCNCQVRPVAYLCSTATILPRKPQPRKRSAFPEPTFALPYARFDLPDDASNVYQDHPNAPQDAQIVVVFFFETPKKGRKSHIVSPVLYKKLFQIGQFDPGLDEWKKKIHKSGREIYRWKRDLGSVSLDSS